MKIHSCIRKNGYFKCEECKESGTIKWAIRHVVENQWNDKSFFTAVDQSAERALVVE